MNTTPLTQTSWLEAARRHARTHTLAFASLSLGLTAVMLLLAQSLWTVLSGELDVGVRYGLLGGLAGFAATALGALPALALHSIGQKTEDSMLGFAAGMMLAATAFSLLLPGLEAGADILGSRQLGAGVVVVGMALGVLMMLGLDAFTPHEHDKTGPCGPGYERFDRVWLFVFAITLHNLPEGMAIGVGFSQGDKLIMLK